VIRRRNGKILHVYESWLSDRSGIHPLMKVTIFRSGELTAFLKQIAEELRKRNQDERADQICRLVEAIEKARAFEQMQSGGKGP